MLVVQYVCMFSDGWLSAGLKLREIAVLAYKDCRLVGAGAVMAVGSITTTVRRCIFTAAIQYYE